MRRSVAMLLAGVASIAVSLAVTLTDSGADATAQTTYTFSSKSFGAAAANRYIIVTWAFINASTVRDFASATIGGVAATPIKTATTGSPRNCGIFGALVPTGTTGNVVITFDGAVGNCQIDIFSVTGLTSLTPTASSTANTDVSGVMDLSLNTLSNSVLIACCLCTSGTSSYTWTGADEVSDTGVAGRPFSSAAKLIAAGSTPLSVTAAGTGTLTNERSCAAVLQ